MRQLDKISANQEADQELRASGLARSKFQSLVRQVQADCSSMKRPASFVNLAQLAQAAGDSDAKVCVFTCILAYVYVYTYTQTVREH